jgi:PPP family 3-phenylpropionic acid transporter
MQSLYYVAYCVVLGYAAVYLGAIGLSSTWIGIILAIGNLFCTFFAPVMAHVIDEKHLSVSHFVMAIGGIVGLLAILMFMSTNMPIVVGILFAILLGFLLCMMPLLNTLAFIFEEHGITLNFGLGRGIGSASYAITSLILGYIVKTYSPKLLPILVLVIMAGLIPLTKSFKIKGVAMKSTNTPKQPTNMKDFVKTYYRFMLMIVGLSLVLADHTLINNFFINIVNHVGGDTSDMGTAVFLAAILELIAMNVFEKIKRRIDVGRLLAFSVVMFSVKHVLTCLAPNMAVIYVAQVLQMFAYAIFIPAGVYYVDQHLPKADTTLGQSLMNNTATVGGIIASAAAGFLIDHTGISNTLLVGAIVSIIGTVIVLLTVERKHA